MMQELLGQENDSENDSDDDNDDQAEELQPETLTADASTASGDDHEALQERVACMLLKSTRLHGCVCGTSHTSGGNCIALSGLAERWSRVPDVLGPLADTTSEISIRRGLSHVLQSDPSAMPDLGDLLCGASDQPRLDLNLSTVPDAEVKVTRRWDVDFSFVPLKSIAAVCPQPTTSFKFVYNAVWTRRLTQSLHVGLKTSDGLLSPHKVKHICIGRSSLGDGYNVYIFFPMMHKYANTNNNRRNNRPAAGTGVHLTDDEQREWIDDIVVPCVGEAYRAGQGTATEAEGSDNGLAFKTAQHHPRTFDEANSRATEPQRTSTTGQRHGLHDVPYDLPQCRLERFWTLVKQKLDLRAGKWAEAQLVALRYGQKLSIDSHSPADLLRKYKHHLSTTFVERLTHMDEIYTDIGYEDFATGPDGEACPIAAIRRTGCNSADANDLKVGSRATSVVYNWHGTEQGSDVTLEPMLNGRVAKLAGFAYTQAYNCIKDLHYHPTRAVEKKFSQRELPLLAYSNGTLQQILQRRNESIRHDEVGRERRISSFREMTRSVNIALQDNARAVHPFSTRQEFRLRMPLLERYVEKLGDGPDVQVLELAAGAHWPFLALKKSEAIDYMRRNIDRWLLPIVPIVFHSLQRQVRERELDEQRNDCSTLTVALDCLSQAVNSGWVERNRKFSKDTYIFHGRPPRARMVGGQDEDEDAGEAEDDCERTGLGVRSALKRLGLVFVARELFHFHGSRMQFRQDALLTNGYVSNDFKASGRETAVFEGQIEVLAKATDLLDAVAHVPTVPVDDEQRRQLADCMDALHQLVYSAYARDVMNHLARSVRPPGLGNLSEDEKLGLHGLNFDMVVRMWSREGKSTDGVQILLPRGRGGNTAGDRTGWSGWPNDMRHRIKLLFAPPDDGFKRTNWNHRDFRLAAETVINAIKAKRSVGQADEWCRALGTGPAASYLTVLPKCEADKWMPGSVKDSRWVVATPESNDPNHPEAVSWTLLVGKPREVESFKSKYRNAQTLCTGVCWRSRRMDKLE